MIIEVLSLCNYELIKSTIYIYFFLRKSKCFEETELKINSPVGTWDVILCKQGQFITQLNMINLGIFPKNHYQKFMA